MAWDSSSDACRVAQVVVEDGPSDSIAKAFRVVWMRFSMSMSNHDAPYWFFSVWAWEIRACAS